MQPYDNIDFGIGVPNHVVRKASEVLLSSTVGRRYPRKIKTRFGIKFVFNVGTRYRLLSNDKQRWKLLTHETYNRYS
ncbi:ParE family toxin-like protein [Psychromonas algarum]|uniref:ParE family toxin-like protein n=1 Tax=Psychromonas algarum TaxID=2555643 RepID=UPI00403EE925